MHSFSPGTVLIAVMQQRWGAENGYSYSAAYILLIRDDLTISISLNGSSGSSRVQKTCVIICSRPVISYFLFYLFYNDSITISINADMVTAHRITSVRI